MNVEMYERALNRTGKIVEGTSAEQMDDSTPCTDWNVRTLMNHIIGGLITFASGAEGNVDDAMFNDTDHTKGDYIATYREWSDRAVAAFTSLDSLDEKLEYPWGEMPASMALATATADASVHGWDLAKATGQDADMDDDIAQAVYQHTSSMMQPQGDFPRGDAFGDPVEVADDARPVDKAVAYLGRQP